MGKVSPQIAGALTVPIAYTLLNRTHQIRLQLAAIGAGIVGDMRYAPVVGKLHDGTSSCDRTDWFGPEPEQIRLHAAQLEFAWGQQRVKYTAGPPWA